MERKFVFLDEMKHPLQPPPNNAIFFIYLDTRDFRVIV